jgi:hypothetical protein
MSYYTFIGSIITSMMLAGIVVPFFFKIKSAIQCAIWIAITVMLSVANGLFWIWVGTL